MFRWQEEPPTPHPFQRAALTSLRHRFIKRSSVKGRMPADRDDRMVGYASFCAPHGLFLKKQVLKQ
jgi:hypothetical protein